jgi:glycosyltransferase involved in cell wall biosynthesis
LSVETTVIVPTLDDAATLPATMEQLNRIVAATGTAAEVIVVDAGSRDGTVTLAGELADRYPLLHMRILVQDRAQSGFGSVVRLGIAYAQGRFCAIVMPDARDPLEVLPKMLAELRKGAHLVLCSRFEAAARDDANVPARFRLYQKLYRRAIRTALGYDIPDSTYGFRAFHRPFVQALGLQAHSFAVCPEITFKVLLAGGTVERVPGAQAASTLQTQEKFRLQNELLGYGVTLARAAMHRAGVRWF